MKIIITENRLEKVLKQSGVKKTIELLGGWENFCKVMNINSPIDFLHLFDDLNVVQSENRENWLLFRNKKGHNLIIYDTKYNVVHIDNNDIWSILHNEFGLNYSLVQGVIKKWLGEVYNLSGITIDNTSDYSPEELDDV